MSDSGITLTRAQLDDWAGFHLTDEEVALIEEALPHSTLSEVIGSLAFMIRPSGIVEDDDVEADGPGQGQ